MGKIKWYYNDEDGIYLNAQDLNNSLKLVAEEAPSLEMRILLDSVILAIDFQAQLSLDLAMGKMGRN